MTTIVREVAGGAAFIIVGAIVALAVALPQGVAANPDPGVSYVWRGTNPSGQYCYPWGDFAGWHPCWHDDEMAGDYTAIDYGYPGVAGDAVSLHYTGASQLFKMGPLPAGYPCTGIRAAIYLGSYSQQNYRGDIHYLPSTPTSTGWIGRSRTN